MKDWIQRAPLTEHAKRRAQQRAISLLKIETVLAHGEWFYDREGSMTAWMGRRTLRALPKRLWAKARECLGVAVSVSADGAIITVQHAPRPKRYWRGAR